MKSTPSNLSKCKISQKQKQKCLYLGLKIPYLGIFELEFEKAIVIFEISTLEYVILQNFAKEIKMPKFGTKNALFGSSLARI